MVQIMKKKVIQHKKLKFYINTISDQRVVHSLLISRFFSLSPQDRPLHKENKKQLQQNNNNKVNSHLLFTIGKLALFKDFTETLTEL